MNDLLKTIPSIGLDVRMIQFSGIGVTIRGFLDHLDKSYFDKLTLFSSPHWANPYPCQDVKVNAGIYSLRQHWYYGRLINKSLIDLFHMPHYDVPLTIRKPFVATVHDLIHYLYPQFSTKPFTKIYSRLILGFIAKKARRIIVDSENTRNDMMAHFPASSSKLVVIHPGIDHDFKPVTAADQGPVLFRHGLKAGYFLYVGNMRESKNTRTLLEAYMDLQKNENNLPPLVLIGKDFMGLSTMKLPSSIRYLGEVEKQDLPALYSAASIFVFPSLYEGFGLPPLEAQACGAPTLVSKRASLPEVCGEASEYIDSPNASQIAVKLNYLHQNPNRRLELTQKGKANIRRFSWSKFAQQTWQVYEDVLREMAL